MKLDRLKGLGGLRQQWSGEIDELRRMQSWLLNTEQILAGQWGVPGERLTNATVGQRFDSWGAHLLHLQATEKLREHEQRCLTHFLQITQGLRPHLIQCSDRADFPRTVPRDGGLHPRAQNALPSGEWPQKLERVSLTLRAVHCVL